MQLGKSLVEQWLTVVMNVSIIIGSLELIFWIIHPKWLNRFRVPQPKDAETRQLQEFPNLLVSITVYLVPLFLLLFVQSRFGYSRSYSDFHSHSFIYTIFSFVIFMVVVDTWLYWQHRLMHSLKFLNNIHAVHHRSLNPTPTSAYNFHVAEALLNTIPSSIMLFVVPWHPIVATAFSLFGYFYNGYIHLGYDFAQGYRHRNRFLKWIYSATHHSIHHQTYGGNFGTYFTFWDKLMGTEILPQMPEKK